MLDKTGHDRIQKAKLAFHVVFDFNTCHWVFNHHLRLRINVTDADVFPSGAFCILEFARFVFGMAAQHLVISG